MGSAQSYSFDNKRIYASACLPHFHVVAKSSNISFTSIKEYDESNHIAIPRLVTSSAQVGSHWFLAFAKSYIAATKEHYCE